jgi:hypothetical protein
MLSLKDRSTGVRGWSCLLIAAVIGSLTFSLATRFWVPLPSQAHTVKSVQRRSLDPKRPHLDRDAAQWVEPVVSFSIVKPASLDPSVATEDPLFQSQVLNKSLYNRPPPSVIIL